MPCSSEEEERRRRGAAEVQKKRRPWLKKGAENMRKKTFQLGLRFGSLRSGHEADGPGRARLLMKPGVRVI